MKKYAETIQFLLYSTEAVQAYLNGICSNNKNKNENSSTKKVVTVCREFYEVSVHLHTILFDLSNHYGCCSCPNDNNILSSSIAVAVQQKL